LRIHLRPSEWIILAFFAYVAFISFFFSDRPDLGLTPVCEFLIVVSVLEVIASLERGRWRLFINRLRDWLPILYTLVAFREMELFLPRRFEGRLEASWIGLDRLLLEHYHLKTAIESLGITVPLYLELCYLFVYGVSLICIAILYLRGKRASIDRFWTIFLTGTLLAYALFPYFPSQPPRYVFPTLDNPGITTWVRQLNGFILNKVTIHSGVFPSAHVSSAFACAWAMFLLVSERKRIGGVLLLYAVSVSLATIYGRYHYTADVMAGFGVSLVAGALAIVYALKTRIDS
jgi:membrane-associated phospholipid phosphatase